MIKTKIQMRFNDMDPMRRVNNASYASYLELGRMDFCSKYFTIETLNDIPFVLVRVEMDILKSLQPGENAEVWTTVSKIGNTSWEFHCRIVNSETLAVYVEAKTVQVYFDYHNNTKLPIPAEFRKILESEKE